MLYNVDIKGGASTAGLAYADMQVIARKAYTEGKKVSVFTIGEDQSQVPVRMWNKPTNKEQNTERAVKKFKGEYLRHPFRSNILLLAGEVKND